MAVEWFCRIMGSDVGPLAQHQLVEMVRNHQVNPEDLIRRGTSQWAPAFEVKGLFEAAAKRPAENSEPVPEEVVEESAHTGGESRDISEPDSANLVRKDTFEDNGTASDWYCIASGEKHGPLDFRDLQSLAKAGTLRDRDRVWRASSPKWQKAAEVEGLVVHQ